MGLNGFLKVRPQSGILYLIIYSINLVALIFILLCNYSIEKLLIKLSNFHKQMHLISTISHPINIIFGTIETFCTNISLYSWKIGLNMESS